MKKTVIITLLIFCSALHANALSITSTATSTFFGDEYSYEFIIDDGNTDDGIFNATLLNTSYGSLSGAVIDLFAFNMNAFLDMGYSDNLYPDESLNNKLENTLLVGYGTGIDFVTYYDLVLRLEYSFNRMSEHGFFVHFMAPI